MLCKAIDTNTKNLDGLTSMPFKSIDWKTGRQFGSVRWKIDLNFIGNWLYSDVGCFVNNATV